MHVFWEQLTDALERPDEGLQLIEGALAHGAWISAYMQLPPAVHPDIVGGSLLALCRALML